MLIREILIVDKNKILHNKINLKTYLLVILHFHCIKYSPYSSSLYMLSYW